MNIITLHEAEQRAEVRKPLWPIYSTFPHCSGPCNQGHKLCTTPEACQTGQHEPDDEAREPAPLAAVLLIVALLATFWGAVIALASRWL